MTKVIWLSRHPMGDDQLADLAKELNVAVSDIEVESRNITWAASYDAVADRAENDRTWDALYRDAGETGVVAGVFPPVALEARWSHRDYLDCGEQVYSPVSKQERKVREDGNAQIKFVHLRWARI